MALGVCHKHLFPKTMKRYILLIALSIFSLNAIHAEITWTLSDDGTLTISGTDMPDFDYYTEPYWNSQKQKIKKIVLKNGVTKIGSYAFYNCNNLTSITIPNSVTSIGDGAFDRCSGLTSIIVEEGSSEFDSRNNCNAIIRTKSNSLIAGCKNTVIPNSVTTIGQRAFQNCSSMSTVLMGDGVELIDTYTFSGCSALTDMQIGNKVSTIDTYAFQNCTSLPKIMIPQSVTMLSHHAILYRQRRSVRM